MLPEPLMPKGPLADHMEFLVPEPLDTKGLKVVVNGFYLLCLERGWFPVSWIVTNVLTSLSDKCENEGLPPDSNILSP